MNESGFTPEFDYEGFGRRLSEAMFPERLSAFALRVGVPHGTISKYMKAGGSSGPRLDIVAILARGLACSIDWLAYGLGDGPATDGTITRVPILDVRLAAGIASFTSAAHQIGEMPFDAALLRSIGKNNTNGLVVVSAEGDSMAPLIPDGARVLVDTTDTRLREAVFAFRVQDELRIKKLRRLLGGIEVISENPRYEPELISGDTIDQFAILGRALLTVSTVS